MVSHTPNFQTRTRTFMTSQLKEREDIEIEYLQSWKIWAGIKLDTHLERVEITYHKELFPHEPKAIIAPTNLPDWHEFDILPCTFIIKFIEINNWSPSNTPSNSIGVVVRFGTLVYLLSMKARASSSSDEHNYANVSNLSKLKYIKITIF